MTERTTALPIADLSADLSAIALATAEASAKADCRLVRRSAARRRNEGGLLIAGRAASVSVRAATRGAAALLAERGIEDAFGDAEILLAHVLGRPRAFLLAHPDYRLSDAPLELYRALVQRRAAREPVAYLTGHVGFRNLDLLVDKRVLIPRPETELVAQAAIEYVTNETSADGPLLAADIGTGSGAMALALAQELPAARVWATDISADALEVARLNAARCGLSARVTFMQGDLCEPLRAPAGERGIRFDVIVSNPPYIAAAEREALPPDVRDYEPPVALWAAGADGLAFYRPLAEGAAELLRPGGVLVLEMPAGRSAAIAEIVASVAQLNAVEIRQDYAGIERVLVARRLPETETAHASHSSDSSC